MRRRFTVNIDYDKNLSVLMCLSDKKISCCQTFADYSVSFVGLSTAVNKDLITFWQIGAIKSSRIRCKQLRSAVTPSTYRQLRLDYSESE